MENDDPHSSDYSRGKMADMIRREFKCPEVDDKTRKDPLGMDYSLETRREVAFMALRELNMKLAWANRLEPLEPHEHQAARFVSPLPLRPEAYLQPGTYLIAHPLMTDYFRRTVICLLHHEDANNDNNSYRGGGFRGTFPSSGSFGTYGLIINRERLFECLS